jgi:hypothetical protein
MDKRDYTARDVAATLGIDDSQVRRMAARLEVGHKVGRAWVFTDQDIERLRQRRTKPGRVASEEAAA